MERTILVVDDESGIRILLKEMFLEQGYHVLTAKTGKESLEKLDKNRVDIMIIDYKLPVMNGMEVLNKLEKNNESIPVILISGMVENIDQDMKKNRLIKSTVAKPFDIEELLSQVASILN